MGPRPEYTLWRNGAAGFAVWRTGLDGQKLYCLGIYKCKADAVRFLRALRKGK